jgi:probable DNA repair protein
MGQATQALERLAADSPFQPESGGAPIQILGMLEAGGQDFDHLWLLGLDDQTWPAPAAPDPLLPAQLQRRLGMPHASAQRELDFARGLTEQLLAAAPEVIVSYARRDGDRELGPSPLIAGLPEQGPPVDSPDQAPMGESPEPWNAPWNAPRSESWNECWGEPSSTPTETIIDTVAPAPDRQLGGGTDLLASQSACPFKAVASHRLRARPLDEVSHAPDPGMLGDQVHKILAALWQRLGNQAGLLASDPTELRTLIDDSVAAVLNEARRDRPDLYREGFTELEHRRLDELIERWLDHERSRPPFGVRQIERREEIELGGLELRVRADRIDVTDAGELIVIDYKTGAAARSTDWLNERLGEPQVPLYATHLQQNGETVAVAALARVRIDDRAGFVGLSERADQFPGVKAFEPDDRHPDWAALLAHWRDGLLALADEVRAGRADPTPSVEACRYCPYPSLCRLADWPEDDSYE